eukprot:6776768-Pyramimonas_sp.AAC.2
MHPGLERGRDRPDAPGPALEVSGLVLRHTLERLQRQLGLREPLVDGAIRLRVGWPCQRLDQLVPPTSGHVIGH